MAHAIAQTGTTLPPPPPFSFDTKINMNPPMAIILVTVIGVFFATAIVSVYVRQCTEGPFADDFDSRRRGARARGLDLVVIASFPMFLYSDVKDHKIGKSALECAICLNEYEDVETLRLLPKCSHVFHPNCIDTWLLSHITCPVCRAILIPQPGDFEKIVGLGHLPNLGSDDLRFDNLVHEVNETVIDIDNIGSPEVINIAQTPTHNSPTRANSNQQKITGKFPRSHSTGHSPVQPGEDCERFTLRLPEEVRNKLTNSGSCQAKNNSLSSSVGTGSTWINHENHERFNDEGREDPWGFKAIPHFFSRDSSTRSSKDGNGGGDDIMGAHKNLFKSVKLAFDRMFEKDSTDKRSINKLRSDCPNN
ncbi:unnamed protein product [Withania somnifera]